MQIFHLALSSLFMMYFSFLLIASLEAFGGHGKFKFKFTYTFMFVKETDMHFKYLNQ